MKSDPEAVKALCRFAYKQGPWSKTDHGSRKWCKKFKRSGKDHVRRIMITVMKIWMNDFGKDNSPSYHIDPQDANELVENFIASLRLKK